MQSFPIVNSSQIVLLRAHSSTGHVLDNNYQIAVNDTQTVFSIFETLEDALVYSQTLLKNRNDIEIVIYDWEKKVISFLRPDTNL